MTIRQVKRVIEYFIFFLNRELQNDTNRNPKKKVGCFLFRSMKGWYISGIDVDVGINIVKNLD